MASNVVFQQTENKSGDTEFRVKFGRNKSLVFRKHEQFCYLDLYDNKFGKARFNGICLGLDELDFIVSIRRDLDSLSTVFPTRKPAEESSHRIQEQGESSRVAFQQPTSTFAAYPFPPAPVQPTSTFACPILPAPVQPTSTFAYPNPPAPVQPTSTFAYPNPPAPIHPQVAYKQSGAFIHPSLNAFRQQPPPSPPAGSCQQIYECEEVVPTRTYPQKRGFTHTTENNHQTFTPAVKDTDDQIKKMRYETISPASYTDEALPENILDDLILFHQMN